MSIYGQADTQVLGGGFGGFGGGYGYGGYGGGYGCGIPAFGLFGLCGGGFGGFNNGCNNKCDHGHHGGHDCHHSESVILDDAHYNSLQASIGGVKDTVVTVKDNIAALGLNIGDKFALTNSLVSDVKFQSALNTKDIIHDIDLQSCALGNKIDKCCCETNHNIDNKIFALSKQLSDCCCEIEKQGLKNTQVILNELKENEVQALRDKLNRCEKENDFFRFNGAVAANFASFKAATAGSNFNTGTQTQSTSNNSGQVVGA